MPCKYCGGEHARTDDEAHPTEAAYARMVGEQPPFWTFGSFPIQGKGAPVHEDKRIQMLREMVNQTQADVFNNLYIAVMAAWRETEPILMAMDTLSREEAVAGIKKLWAEKLEALS